MSHTEEKSIENCNSLKSSKQIFISLTIIKRDVRNGRTLSAFSTKDPVPQSHLVLRILSHCHI